MVSQNTSTTIAMSTVVIIITYFSLIIGELVPKRLALRYPEVISIICAPILNYIAHFASPIVWFLEISSSILLKCLGIATHHTPEVTEEEVQALITASSEAGILKPKEKDMIEGVMRFADKSVKSFMTPRIKIEWIDVNDSENSIRKKILQSNYSRFIICDGNLDQVLGIAQAKDIANQLMIQNKLDLKALIINTIFFAENSPALKIIDFLRESTLHIAIIVDEYGTVSGIITATNILEAIVGDLADAEDIEEATITIREDGTWLIDGEVEFDKVMKCIGMQDLHISKNFHTIAGFILAQVSQIPRAGDHFIFHGYRFEVIDMDKNRIDKVLIEKVEQ